LLGAQTTGHWRPRERRNARWERKKPGTTGSGGTQRRRFPRKGQWAYKREGDPWVSGNAKQASEHTEPAFEWCRQGGLINKGGIAWKGGGHIMSYRKKMGALRVSEQSGKNLKDGLNTPPKKKKKNNPPPPTQKKKQNRKKRKNPHPHPTKKNKQTNHTNPPQTPPKHNQKNPKKKKAVVGKYSRERDFRKKTETNSETTGAKGGQNKRTPITSKVQAPFTKTRRTILN